MFNREVQYITVPHLTAMVFCIVGQRDGGMSSRLRPTFLTKWSENLSSDIRVTWLAGRLREMNRSSNRAVHSSGRETRYGTSPDGVLDRSSTQLLKHSSRESREVSHVVCGVDPKVMPVDGGV